VSRQGATAAGSAEEPKATALLPLVGLPEPLVFMGDASQTPRLYR
jgi:hypothetical protein